MPERGQIGGLADAGRRSGPQRRSAAAWPRTISGTTRRPFSTARRSDCRCTWTASSTRRRAPGPSNPVDISPIGVSTSRMMGAIVIIASPGCGSPFVGWLDEVSIFHKALKPAEFCLQHDYPTPYGGPAVTYPASGSYLSPPYDWATAARLTDLTVAADLHGGQVTATVEISNDGFRTVASSTQVRVQDGVNTYPLNSLRGSEQAVRVRLDLMRGPDAARTPVVDGFRITANPAN